MLRACVVKKKKRKRRGRPSKYRTLKERAREKNSAKKEFDGEQTERRRKVRGGSYGYSNVDHTTINIWAFPVSFGERIFLDESKKKGGRAGEWGSPSVMALGGIGREHPDLGSQSAI